MGSWYALAVNAPADADPASDAVLVCMRKDRMLRVLLARDGADEEGARRGRVREIGAFAFVTRLEVNKLALLVAIARCP